MRKILAFATRKDEEKAFQRFSKEFNLEITYISEQLSKDNVHLTKGYELVSILGLCDASAEIIKKLKENGVKYLGVRSAGYNNVDLKAAKEYGIRVSNATYSPNCVADFTLMHILMAMRQFKRMFQRSMAQDYSIRGNQGREMHNLTIGILGVGRIGSVVAKNLSGFGCKIIGHDLLENDQVKNILTYVDLETLLKESDVITIHTDLNESSYHIMNKERINKMKENAILINCARGELVETDALIKALEDGKLAAAGLDVFEGDNGILHNDRRFDVLNNHALSILESLPNVILTPHLAFYTDQAVSDMVEIGLRSLVFFADKGESPWEVGK